MKLTIRPIEEIAYSAIKEYAEYICKSRVLPHLDLKPVHRRILWAMIKEGARHGKGSYRKSNSIIGVTAKYHPHGDKSIYDALCHLINTPNALVEGRGNFGSYYGDPPAAARYTEARTSALFEYLLDSSMFDIGDYIPSYDETDKEPILFQTKLPILPFIGLNGIGLGFSTQYPAFDFKTVKERILSLLNTKDIIGGQIIPNGFIIPNYAYGGISNNGKIYPKTEIKELNGKSYLHITEIPKTCTFKILNNSPLISELISAKVIEIIDESDIKKISIYISAPESIQKLIINSMTLSTREDLKYYWKRMRFTNYYDEWINERIRYVLKRERYIITNKIIKDTELRILDELCWKQTSNIDEVCDYHYKSYLDILKPELKVFNPTLEEFKNKIKSKPISSIRRYIIEKDDPELPTEESVKKLIIKEINSLNPDLFSKSSIPGNTKYVKFNSSIKRYVTIKDNCIEVKFNKSPRILNWEIDTQINVIYSDASSEIINDYFFGQIGIKDNKVPIGFSIHNRPTVVITQSKKLKVISRLSSINEPIINAFPATKLLINNKEYLVQRGLEINEINNWKILET